MRNKQDSNNQARIIFHGTNFELNARKDSLEDNQDLEQTVVQLVLDQIYGMFYVPKKIVVICYLVRKLFRQTFGGYVCRIWIMLLQVLVPIEDHGLIQQFTHAADLGCKR